MKIQPPAPMLCQALIDTGANLTCIDPAVVAKLSLTPKGNRSRARRRWGWTTEGAQTLRCHDLRFNYTLNHEVAVAESPLKNQGIQVLLGMDVLARCLLIVDGPSSTFTLAI